MSAAGTSLWVRSELLPTGVYGVGISVGPDRAWTLTPDRAVAYAVACFARAAEAQHNVALINALCATGITYPDALSMVTHDLSPDRTVDQAATAPLRLEPAVGRRTGGPLLPLLVLEVDGQRLGEVPVAALAEHAAAVLQVLRIADLDAGVVRALRGMGVDEPHARALVDSMGAHWPGGVA